MTRNVSGVTWDRPKPPRLAYGSCEELRDCGCKYPPDVDAPVLWAHCGKIRVVS